MTTLISILEILLAFLLSLQVLYYLFFAVASLFKVKRLPVKNQNQHKIAVFIPAYKEDNIIITTARKCLEQTYPSRKFEVIVLADSLKDKTMDGLLKLPVTTINIEFEKSTKAKSLNLGLSKMRDQNFEIAVVLDADNVMVPDFLERVNNSFNAGYRAFQGHRVAKNDNTNLSILDGLSEEISNNIYRKGHSVLGLSSSLAGSGMAFDYNLLSEVMSNISDHAAEDKLMQMDIASRKTTILYDAKAVVYDEKVSNINAFKSQRSRWLAAQYDAFLRFWHKGIAAAFKGNLSYASFTFQFFLIPKTILLGFLIAIAVLAIFNGLNTWLWLSIAIVFLLSMFLATPRRYYELQTLKALFMAPFVLFEMLVIVTKIRSIAIDKFVVTEKKVS